MGGETPMANEAGADEKRMSKVPSGLAEKRMSKAPSSLTPSSLAEKRMSKAPSSLAEKRMSKAPSKAAFTWEKEIERNWWKLGLAPEEYWNNRDVVMSAIKQDGLALRYASSKLRNDWVFVANAVCRDGEALQFASNELRNDAKIARWAMGMRDCPAEQMNIEQWTGPDLTEYNELATKRVPQPNCARHASEQLRGQDKELMLHAIKEYWFAADHLALPLRDSKPFWKEVIEQNDKTGWQAFGNYAPVMLREDEELLETALLKDPFALHYAGPSLRRRRSFVLAAVQRDWKALLSAPKEFLEDSQVLLAAAMQNLEALEYASGDLGNMAACAVQPPSKQIMEEQEAWTGLQDVDEVERRAKQKQELKKEWNRVMLCLAKTHGRALSFMRPTGVDRDLTTTAIKSNGVALAYAEAQYQEDRDMVNESVRANIGSCSGLVWKTRGEIQDELPQEKVPKPKKRETLKVKNHEGEARQSVLPPI